MRLSGIRAAALVAACAIWPASAWAGAFTLEPGEAKLFATSMVTTGDEYFDAKGKTRPRGRYTKIDHQLYGEYGALDGLTAFGSIAYQTIRAFSTFSDS